MDSKYFQSKKQRLSTKDRFQGFLRNPGKRDIAPSMPWYRKRYNFLVLLMIIVIFAFLIIIKSLSVVQEDLRQLKQANPDAESADMPYEDAKDIFKHAPNPRK
jgi:hypothetical protein